jgi:DNA-directed RNA polymerase subunit K/omega
MAKKNGVVETCLKNHIDPFSLVVLAAYRAQELESGISPTIPAQGHKNTIVALQEIATSHIQTQDVMQRMVKGFQKYSFLEEADKDRQSGGGYQIKEGTRPARSDWQDHWKLPSHSASEALFEVIEWNQGQLKTDSRDQTDDIDSEEEADQEMEDQEEGVEETEDGESEDDDDESEDEEDDEE